MSVPWPALLVSSPEEVRKVVEFAYSAGYTNYTRPLSDGINNMISSLRDNRGTMLIYMPLRPAIQYVQSITLTYEGKDLARLNSLAHLKDYLARYNR